MSAQNGSAIPEQANEFADKGKGKATEQPSHDLPIDDDEEDEEEEDEVEDNPEEEEDEDMEEIDPDNIISRFGERSSRRKVIDWAEAEQKSKDAGDEIDEDEDEDDDFEDPDAGDEDHEMKD